MDKLFETLDQEFFTGTENIAFSQAKEYPYALHEGSLNVQSLEMLNVAIANIYGLHRLTLAYSTIAEQIRGINVIGIASGIAAQKKEVYDKNYIVGIEQLINAIRDREEGIFTVFAFTPHKFSVGNITILERIFTDIRCYRRYNPNVDLARDFIFHGKRQCTIFFEVNFQLSLNNVFIEPYCQIGTNGTRIIGIRLFGVQHGFQVKEKLRKFEWLSFDTNKMGFTVTPFVIY